MAVQRASVAKIAEKIRGLAEKLQGLAEQKQETLSNEEWKRRGARPTRPPGKNSPTEERLNKYEKHIGILEQTADELEAYE